MQNYLVKKAPKICTRSTTQRMALYRTFPVSDWIMNPSELMKSATFAAKASARCCCHLSRVNSCQLNSNQLKSTPVISVNSSLFSAAGHSKICGHFLSHVQTCCFKTNKCDIYKILKIRLRTVSVDVEICKLQEDLITFKKHISRNTHIEQQHFPRWWESHPKSYLLTLY